MWSSWNFNRLTARSGRAFRMPVRRVRQPDTQDLTFSTLRLVAEVKELVRELEVQASLARVGGGEPYRRHNV